MAVAVGQQTVVGFAAESTWGTPVTVTRFLDILSESLELSPETIQSEGLRGGTRNARTGSRRSRSTRSAGGDIEMEVPTRGFGLLLKMLLGSSVTSATQQGSTAAYLQTHTIGTQTSKSMTIQKQLRDGAGTEVESFTYEGAKVVSGEFSVSVGELLKASLSIDAQDEITSTAAASASFLANSSVFSFQDVGTLTLDGSAAATVSEFSIKVENALKTDRYFLGNSGVKDEQMDNGFVTVTGQLTAEFASTTYYDAFKNDTPLALVCRATGDVIESPHSEYIEFSCPQIRLMGETPKVGNMEILTVSVPFEAYAPDDGSSAITIKYMSRDTAV